MKNFIIVVAVTLFIGMAACKKNELPAPQVIPNSSVYKFGGTYSGLYTIKNSGADSSGVYKDSTTYPYSLKVSAVGSNQVFIEHGPIILPTLTVDETNHFSFTDYNHFITGYFANDSLILESNSLNGAYDTVNFVGDWFVIQKLNFKGKKDL